jgi:Glycosyltransferase family 87
MAGVAGVLGVALARGLRFSDVDVYHREALAFWSGGHRLPTEYPILAMVPFSLTLPPAGIDYAWVFSFAMAALFFVGWIAVARMAGRRAGVAYVVYLLVGGFGVILARYDLVPALVTVAAIAAAERKRWSIAYMLLGLGVLLKIYPVVLLPVFAIQQVRSGTSPPKAVTSALWFALTVAAGVAASIALAGPGWLDPLRFAIQRPVQVESVPATFLSLASLLGWPAAFDHTFNSFNITGPGDRVVSALFSAFFVIGSLFVLYRQATGRLTLRRACLACVCLLLATSKVLSTQYLIWVLPLVAIELELDPVWILICVLTTLIFPGLYFLTALIDQAPEATATAYTWPFLVAVATRNALLVAATLAVLSGSAHRDVDRRPHLAQLVQDLVHRVR